MLVGAAKPLGIAWGSNVHRPTVSRGFEQQLDGYSATSKSIVSASNWRDRLGSWPIYAAATASALACATSASASTIHYSGTVNIRTPTSKNYANPFFSLHTVYVHFPGYASLDLAVSTNFQDRTEQARVRSGYLLNFLRSAAHPALLALLPPNVLISSVPGGQNFGLLRKDDSSGNWRPGNQVTGFAGFEFKTNVRSSYDYGWLRLSVTANGSGDPTEVTLIDYAYNETPGQSIETGQESATPEPGAKAMMLLAAGFAGVLAWRRRRAAAV